MQVVELASADGTLMAATPITIARGATAIATREAACLMPVLLLLKLVMLVLVICLKWVEEVIPPGPLHHRRSCLKVTPPTEGFFKGSVSPNWVGNKKTPPLLTG